MGALRFAVFVHEPYGDDMSRDGSGNDWWVTVHTEKRGPYPDHASALGAATKAKLQNPNKHVAVVDPKGMALPIG